MATTPKLIIGFVHFYSPTQIMPFLFGARLRDCAVEVLLLFPSRRIRQYFSRAHSVPAPTQEMHSKIVFGWAVSSSVLTMKGLV